MSTKNKTFNMSKGKIVMLVIALIATIGLIICFIVDRYERGQIEKLASLQDTRLFSYEAEIEEVRKITKIYSIYNEETYQDAKSSIKMTSDLSKILFPTEHYGAENGIEPSVRVVDIQYVYAPESEVQTFVVWLTKEVNGEIREFDVVCKYHQGYLMDLQGY